MCVCVCIFAKTTRLSVVIRNTPFFFVDSNQPPGWTAETAQRAPVNSRHYLPTNKHNRTRHSSTSSTWATSHKDYLNLRTWSIRVYLCQVGKNKTRRRNSRSRKSKKKKGRGRREGREGGGG